MAPCFCDRNPIPLRIGRRLVSLFALPVALACASTSTPRAVHVTRVESTESQPGGTNEPTSTTANSASHADRSGPPPAKRSVQAKSNDSATTDEQSATKANAQLGAENETSPSPRLETKSETNPTALAPMEFEGRTTVSYAEFIDAFRMIADELSAAPEVQAAHAVLLEEKNLSERELPLESFSRVRLAFESGRDSGLWGIRGAITDQMPWSDRVWAQWDELKFSLDGPLSAIEEGTESEPVFPTAEAECDELGALFSILARDMGVVGFVGLHWPYWNHVVPIWQVNREDGSFVRIVVPATQSFLTPTATIGTTELPTNRHVFPYVRKDRKHETLLKGDLVRFLLHQSRTYGGLGTQALTQKRLWHRWKHRPQAGETAD